MFVQLITELLQGGFAVKFKACGRSMQPTIHEGETITVEPTDPVNVREGDIVLYRQNGRIIAHRVLRIVKFTEQSVETSKFELPYEIADLKHSELVLNAGSGVCHVQPDDHQLTCSAQSVDRIEFQSRQAESTEEALPSALTSVLSPSFSGLGSQCYFILRGDAATSCDDPVQPDQVLGKVVCVQRNGSRIELGSRKSKWKAVMRSWAAGLKRKVFQRKPQTNLCN
jgi:Peptidase S24-like